MIKEEILWKEKLPLLERQTDYKYRRVTVMALTGYMYIMNK